MINLVGLSRMGNVRRASIRRGIVCRGNVPGLLSGPPIFLQLQKKQKILKFTEAFGNGVGFWFSKQQMRCGRISLTSKTASIGDPPSNISAANAITNMPLFCRCTGRNDAINLSLSSYIPIERIYTFLRHATKGIFKAVTHLNTAIRAKG